MTSLLLYIMTSYYDIIVTNTDCIWPTPPLPPGLRSFLKYPPKIESASANFLGKLYSFNHCPILTSNKAWILFLLLQATDVIHSLDDSTNIFPNHLNWSSSSFLALLIHLASKDFWLLHTSVSRSVVPWTLFCTGIGKPQPSRCRQSRNPRWRKASGNTGCLHTFKDTEEISLSNIA